MASFGVGEEWTMPDGSIFVTVPVLDDADGRFSYTSVTAIVAGKAYAGRLDQEHFDVDALCMDMHEIPMENIWPRFPETFTQAPAFDPKEHFLKAPSLTYEDSIEGKTFVAERMLSEVDKYEILKKRPHPHIGKYYGCVVEHGRIKQICLQKYKTNLMDVLNETNGFEHADREWEQSLFQIISAVRHLHGLGLVHNDIGPWNIWLDEEDNAILSDLDSCEKVLAPVLKGNTDHSRVSLYENDWLAIAQLEDLVRSLRLRGSEDKSDR